MEPITIDLLFRSGHHVFTSWCLKAGRKFVESLYPGFLNLGLIDIDIWGWITLHCGGRALQDGQQRIWPLPTRCQKYHHHHHPHSCPTVTTKTVSRRCQMFTRGVNLSLVETCWSDRILFWYRYPNFVDAEESKGFLGFFCLFVFLSPKIFLPLLCTLIPRFLASSPQASLVSVHIHRKHRW